MKTIVVSIRTTSVIRSNYIPRFGINSGQPVLKRDEPLPVIFCRSAVFDVVGHFWILADRIPSIPFVHYVPISSNESYIDVHASDSVCNLFGVLEIFDLGEVGECQIS